MILLKQLALTGGLAAVIALALGCKTEKAPKTPKKEQSLDSENEGLGDDEGEDESGDEPFTPADDDPAEEFETLSLEVSDASALQAKIGSPLSITFNVKGAGSRDVLVGMISSPAGATVEISGTTVTYKWQTPTGGTYPLKFLLRDKAKCEEAESASQCEVSGSETGLSPKSYDVASQEFSLEVETEDNLGLPGTDAGGLGGLGGLGGGNDQLIQQIISLLGGGGGGATGLLQGLSNGQLQTILGQLQNGGGGGGIGQLIGLIGNL